MEGRHVTRAESRWGCFLPDLTRLASGDVHHRPSAPHIELARSDGKARATCYGFDVPDPQRFQLDRRLAATTHPVRRIAGCELLLADDARWPWLIVVPMAPDLRDLHDLSEAQTRIVSKIARNCSRTLRAMDPACIGTNVATLGNVVAQFHLHVVARREGDPNWPGPIWGFGEAEPYTDPVPFVTAFEAAYERAVPPLDRI